MSKFKTNTGGRMSFGDPGNLSDTEPSKEFKKAYLLHHFLKNPHDEENKEKLKDHISFYSLIISLDKKEKPTVFDLEFYYEKGKKPFLKAKDVKGEYYVELPKARYTVHVITKNLLFFKKTKKHEIDLSKDKRESVRY